jgi:hypothetical protein
VQCIFSDAGGIVLSAWTTDLVTVCVEVSYGTVSSEGSCCTGVTTLDKIIEDEGTLLTKGYERKLDELHCDLPIGGAKERKERKTYWLRQDKEGSQQTPVILRPCRRPSATGLASCPFFSGWGLNYRQLHPLHPAFRNLTLFYPVRSSKTLADSL